MFFADLCMLRVSSVGWNPVAKFIICWRAKWVDP